MMELKRGDVVFVQMGLTKTVGAECHAGRPAVVVSNDIGNKHSDAVEVVYLTSQGKKELPTHCMIKARVLSTALCEQVTTISKDRISDYIRTCTETEMKKIDRCLKVSLGLTNDERPVEAPKNDNVEFERDFYKKMYEDLLERMMK